jgi:hypothetical protein
MSRWSDTSEPVPPSLVCSKFQVSHHPRASGETDCDVVGFYFCVFYYESRKREIKTRFVYEDRCDERLKARVKLRNLHVSHTLGCVIPAVIHT